MVCCGWALQALRRYPGIWEERYRSQFSNDWRVYMVPEGTRQVAFPTQGLELGPVQANLVSTPRALIVFGRCRGDSAVVKLYSRPDQQGTYAAVTLKADGTVTAVNDRGAALRITGQTTRQDTGFQFRFTLPYTVAKGQKGWANGIEHARYSIQIGQERRNLYVMSSEREVKAWLEHELGGGLRTWEAIFNEKGFIPTGLGTGSDWDRYSDNGGYAHLISAASEWLLWLEGKRDWEQHHIPAVLTDTSATDRDRTPLRPNRAR
jgi:hypothetical protein